MSVEYDCQKSFAVDEGVEPKGCPHCLQEVYEYIGVFKVSPYIPGEKMKEPTS